MLLKRVYIYCGEEMTKWLRLHMKYIPDNKSLLTVWLICLFPFYKLPLHFDCGALCSSEVL